MWQCFFIIPDSLSKLFDENFLLVRFLADCWFIDCLQMLQSDASGLRLESDDCNYV